jgi:hypothetical protein
MNDENEGAASYLDKLDWRKEIQRLLSRCINYKGTDRYYISVERTITAIACDFPGWDAFTQLNKEIDKIQEYYNGMANKWIMDNPEKWGHPRYKVLKTLEWRTQFYDEVFTYLMNCVAKKRMLLWGTRKVPKGQQMPDVE